MNDEWFDVDVDGRRVWHTDGYGEEYDAIHAAAGALLAGADHVEIRRQMADEDAADEDGKSDDGGDSA